jgi:hypothetical protein
MGERYYWADVLTELRHALIRVEDSTRQRLRVDAGVWIEQFTSRVPHEGDVAGVTDPGVAAAGAAAAMPSSGSSMENEMFRRRYGLPPVAGAPPPVPPPPVPEGGAPAPDGGAAAAPAKPVDTNEISSITITFRAVSLTAVSGQPEANKETAYAVLAEIRNSPPFDPNPQETRFVTDPGPDESPGTFKFQLVAKLKRPLKIF